MKQAKLALTATAVLAVIGGAIAFKSRSNGLVIYTKTTTTTTAPCDKLSIGFYRTVAGATVQSYATAAPGACLYNKPFVSNE